MSLHCHQAGSILAFFIPKPDPILADLSLYCDTSLNPSGAVEISHMISAHISGRGQPTQLLAHHHSKANTSKSLGIKRKWRQRKSLGGGGGGFPSLTVKKPSVEKVPSHDWRTKMTSIELSKRGKLYRQPTFAKSGKKSLLYLETTAVMYIETLQ